MGIDSRLFEILEPARNENYGLQELPIERDSQIRDLLLRVADAPTFEHATLSMPRNVDWVLVAFAVRAASMAVRHEDEREVRAGLVAAAIAHTLTDDYRDVVHALAPLYRACEMIGLDPDSEFRATNELCGDQVPALVEFLRRVPDDRSLQAMMYEEGRDERGFRFLRNWKGSYGYEEPR